jgi:hypothetical protein
VLSYDASRRLANVLNNSDYKEMILTRSQKTDMMYCTGAYSKV